jgi:hypothetical protein
MMGAPFADALHKLLVEIDKHPKSDAPLEDDFQTPTVYLESYHFLKIHGQALVDALYDHDETVANLRHDLRHELEEVEHVALNYRDQVDRFQSTVDKLERWKRAAIGLHPKLASLDEFTRE